MIEYIGSAFFGASAALLVAFDVVLKATIVLALAYAVHAALGRGRVLARSALWDATLIGLALLPLAGLAFPHLRLAVLPAAKTAPALDSMEHRAGAFRENTTVAEESPVQAAPIALAPAGPLQSTVAAGAVSGEPVLEKRVEVTWLVPGVYLAVAALLAIRLAASLAAVRGLKRRCEPVDDPTWLRALDHTQKILNIPRPVGLVKSSRVSIPMVVGWLRPMILLPESLVQAANPEMMDIVLIHELAHVRRGDFAWNLMHKLVRLIYWPHPLIWPVGRIMGTVREQACDDLCVHGTGSAAAYRAALLEVASGLVRRPELSLGLALARELNLSRRLAWIDASPGKSQCLLSRPARLGMGLAVMVVTGFLGSIEIERQAFSAERQVTQPPAIEIVVLAKDTGKRLPGASVRYMIDFEQPTRTADQNGVVRLDLRQRKFQDSLTLDVWADGYIQQRYFFAQNDARYPNIPAQFTVELLPGEETLGGKVTDDRGQPIRGVEVKIWGYLGEKKEKHELAYMVSATTDEQGQWRCRCFRGLTFAYLFLSHADYLSDGDGHPREHGKPRPDMPSPANDQSLEGLRDFSDVQVLTAGVSLEGKVTDEQDKPIAGAEVGWLDEDGRNAFHDDVPVTTTDARGYFRFPHVRPGPLAVQVKAKGHAPAIKPLNAIDLAGHLTLKLGPPHVLSGLVVDSGGKPIPDVFVCVDTWRRYRSLGVFLKTDAAGAFRWDDAPPDAVLINASRAGFARITHRRISPEGKAITLVLKRSLSISGRITDSATGEPIDQPDVEVGTADAKTGDIVWARERNVFSFQGGLQASIDVEKRSEIRLRINATDYEPVVSRVFRRHVNQVEYDVKMRKADTPQRTAMKGVG